MQKKKDSFAVAKLGDQRTVCESFFVLEQRGKASWRASRFSWNSTKDWPQLGEKNFCEMSAVALWWKIWCVTELATYTHFIKDRWYHEAIGIYVTSMVDIHNERPIIVPLWWSLVVWFLIKKSKYLCRYLYQPISK